MSQVTRSAILAAKYESIIPNIAGVDIPAAAEGSMHPVKAQNLATVVIFDGVQIIYLYHNNSLIISMATFFDLMNPDLFRKGSKFLNKVS